MSRAVEAAGLALQTLVDHLGPQVNRAVLQIDVSNAFNTVRRTSILEGAMARTPALYNFLRYAYGKSVPLLLGTSQVSSETGTHQGCPLGPVGFALGVQDILEEVARLAGLTWSSWCL